MYFIECLHNNIQCKFNLPEDWWIDLPLARKYWQKAADLGNAHAIYNLGISYAEGTIVERNLSKALECVERAADAGCVNAYYMLGQIYENGEKIDISNHHINT